MSDAGWAASWKPEEKNPDASRSFSLRVAQPNSTEHGPSDAPVEELESATAPFERRPAALWTPSDVALWLDHAGLGDVAQHFERNSVTGAQLLNLGRGDVAWLELRTDVQWDRLQDALYLARAEAARLDAWGGFLEADLTEKRSPSTLERLRSAANTSALVHYDQYEHFQSLVSRGVPAMLRPQLWQLFCAKGGSRREGYYPALATFAVQEAFRVHMAKPAEEAPAPSAPEEAPLAEKPAAVGVAAASSPPRQPTPPESPATPKPPGSPFAAFERDGATCALEDGVLNTAGWLQSMDWLQSAAWLQNAPELQQLTSDFQKLQQYLDPAAVAASHLFAREMLERLAPALGPDMTAKLQAQLEAAEALSAAAAAAQPPPPLLAAPTQPPPPREPQGPRTFPPRAAPRLAAIVAGAARIEAQGAGSAPQQQTPGGRKRQAGLAVGDWRTMVTKIDRELPGTASSLVMCPRPVKEADAAAARRVLLAYARHNPEVGYCAGMNYIVLLLLLHMPEETTFWALTQVVEEILPGYYSQPYSAALTDAHVLVRILRERRPTVREQFPTSDNFPVETVAQWLQTSFTRVLPWDIARRVWDVVLSERSRAAMLQVALSLLETSARELSVAPDTAVAEAILRRAPTKAEALRAVEAVLAQRSELSLRCLPAKALRAYAAEEDEELACTANKEITVLGVGPRMYALDGWFLCCAAAAGGGIGLLPADNVKLAPDPRSGEALYTVALKELQNVVINSQPPALPPPRAPVA